MSMPLQNVFIKCTFVAYICFFLFFFSVSNPPVEFVKDRRLLSSTTVLNIRRQRTIGFRSNPPPQLRYADCKMFVYIRRKKTLLSSTSLDRPECRCVYRSISRRLTARFEKRKKMEKYFHATGRAGARCFSIKFRAKNRRGRVAGTRLSNRQREGCAHVVIVILRYIWIYFLRA